MEKATIHDYARFCRACDNCIFCPLSSLKNGMNVHCTEFIESYTAKASEIILKWCKEHPIKTRQSEFLKMFPNAETNGNGRISICPKNLDKNYGCELEPNACGECMDNYWLAEVDEHDK